MAEEIIMIKRELSLPLSAEKAYETFLLQFADWWPKGYSWSQEALEKIVLEPKVGGKLYEVGPEDFTCQFGRVLACQPNEEVIIAWHIGPGSRPQPAPANASEIVIRFQADNDKRSMLSFTHEHIARHGEGAEQYARDLDSEYGWDWVLQQYQDFIA